MHLLNRPSLDLLRCQGKHRKQFNHYFYDDLHHHGSGGSRHIDLQTLKEVAQALEQFEKGIVARCNPTSSLSYQYIKQRR